MKTQCPGTVSIRVQERNRQNAQLSTGPSTSVGKTISRTNSLRHGFCANPAAGVVEDAHAFDDLHADLVKELVPRNSVEARLVHRIAVCLWRLQRTAMVDAAISSLAVTATVPMRDRVQKWVSLINSMFMPAYEEVTDPAKRPRWFDKDMLFRKYTRPYLARLDSWRDDPDGQIRKDGAAIEAMAVMLKSLARQLAGVSAYSLNALDAQTMAWLLGESAGRYELAEVPPEEEQSRDTRFVFPDEQPWRQETDILIGQARKRQQDIKYALPPELAAAIEGRLATFRIWNDACDDPATKEQAELHRTAALLPDAPTMDRLIRYETHADKSLHRALETLAKLRGATVETIKARVTGRAEDGTRVELQGQRTRWSGEPAAQA
ncbi:MAG: hypothetical protein K8S99_00755 [Planctomycetes bacterium]|nr:hypothetical protein [Planctomycetota bacterium]